MSRKSNEFEILCLYSAQKPGEWYLLVEKTSHVIDLKKIGFKLICKWQNIPASIDEYCIGRLINRHCQPQLTWDARCKKILATSNVDSQYIRKFIDFIIKH